MEWNEIKMRLRDGASVQILADLEGVPYKTMYNRIKQHEIKDGVVYMKPEQLNKRKKKQPEVIEPKPEEVRPSFVLHPNPESVEAIDKMEEKLQEARDKMTYAFSQIGKKISERLQETIPAPEVTIQIVEDAEKGPEEEGESPELTETKSDICNTCIHNLISGCEWVKRKSEFHHGGCVQYENQDVYMKKVRDKLRAEEAGTPSEYPEEEGESPEEKWQKQQLSRVADKIIDELDQRIDLLNDELQRIEDKKIELLYEVGIWKNIMNALQRERGIK